MRQSWETRTPISAGHIILTPTQPVGSGRPQRGSNPGPPDQESRVLPTCGQAAETAQHVLQDCRLYSNVRQSIWRERVDMHTKLYGPLPENGSLHCPGWNRNLKRASENEKKKKKIHHTGFIKCDIQYTRRKDLEADEVERLWIELQLPVLSVFIGFIYKNPRDMILWEDHFCDMLDNILYL